MTTKAKRKRTLGDIRSGRALGVVYAFRPLDQPILHSVEEWGALILEVDPTASIGCPAKAGRIALCFGDTFSATAVSLALMKRRSRLIVAGDHVGVDELPRTFDRPRIVPLVAGIVMDHDAPDELRVPVSKEARAWRKQKQAWRP